MHMLEFQTDDDAGNGKNRWVVHTSPITSMRGLLVITYRVVTRIQKRVYFIYAVKICVANQSCEKSLQLWNF